MQEAFAQQSKAGSSGASGGPGLQGGGGLLRLSEQLFQQYILLPLSPYLVVCKGWRLGRYGCALCGVQVPSGHREEGCIGVRRRMPPPGHILSVHVLQ